jgi:1,4-alpha-glucan branching enzyme/maltooligosyltrehalose trehalohydrolase
MRRQRPFGAEVSAAGTSFRLWAPEAENAPVLLVSGREIVMDEAEGGFYEVFAEGVGPGAAYAFRVNGHEVADPGSRLQETDVHGRSLVQDPAAYHRQHGDFRPKPFAEAVIYECHVGTFTEAGTYAGIEEKLDHLQETGVNTIELMPLAHFSGDRGWGYDGVLPYAPHNAYGTPEDLRHLIDACHARDMAVMLDVVYNHFGPDGNYLYAYAKSFFDEKQKTPWGAALDFSRKPVRDYFIHNALMWLEEYRFDGLRFDAVHAIDRMAGDEPYLEEMSRAIREALPDRELYLVLENDDNAAHLIGEGHPYTAQWNDDIHHILHRLATGETDGYYSDYEDRPVSRLVKTLTEGFDYQGEPSGHRGGTERGEPSGELPPSAFVAFVQNHDQVGNRAEGERLSDTAPSEAVEVVTAIYLLGPQVPMVWMGEEWAATSRFPFFCDFHGELADAVREGRRREFAQFKRFRDEKAREAIPDPNAPETFKGAKLDWSELNEPRHQARLKLFRQLIALRKQYITPLTATRHLTSHGKAEERRFEAVFTFEVGSYTMAGQLGGAPGPIEPPSEGELIYLRGGEAGGSASWWLAVSRET